jgi:hypothetical protein
VPFYFCEVASETQSPNKEKAVRIIKPALLVLACYVVIAFLSRSASAGTLQLRNDNGEIGSASWAGREVGDIDGAVFFPAPELFPLTVRSVEFVLHKPAGAPYLMDEAQVRVHIYAMAEAGTPGEILASSDVQTVTTLDDWISIPLPTPVTFAEPTSFMAAVEWRSGTFYTGAPAVATDTNREASQEEKDAKNLYYDASVPPSAPGCGEGFCTHSQLWGSHSAETGFNMIRVTVDTAFEPTPTATEEPATPTPTATPASTPPSPSSLVYLPVIAHNAVPTAARLVIGGEEGTITGYSLTSGMADECWDPVVFNLWVGYDPEGGRGRMRSVLRIDLSQIPPDATILDADLELFLLEVVGDPSPLWISVHNVTQEWPDCPTWESLAEAVGSEYGAAFIGGEIFQFYTVDITQLVQAWVSGELPNYGLLLRPSEENGDMLVRGFVSPDSDQGDLRPRLFVRYTQ